MDVENSTREDNYKKIAYILIGVILNIIGRTIAEKLCLPIWLDTVGTCFCAIGGGTVAGMIVAAVSHAIFAICGISNLIYGAISIVVALIIGTVYKKGWLDTLFNTVCTSFLITFVCVIWSAPINLKIYDGMTGNLWGDAMVDMLSTFNTPKILSAFLGEALVDFPDKAISLLIVYVIFHELKRGKGDAVEIKE